MPHSSSSFNPTTFLQGLVDPFHIFPKIQKTVQHTVDSADHIANRGLNAGQNAFDSGANVLEHGTEGLDKLIQMMTKFAPLLIGGIIVLTVLK